ncbi:MAG: carboxyl-terminal processing protease, partial [Flavobacterium sp.]
NEDVLSLGILGDPSEPLLEKVLEAISSGSTGTSAACNANNYTFLYNSINAQRAFDTGIFIKQNLPNTN